MSLSYSWGSLACRKFLRHGNVGFTPPKKVALKNTSPSARFGPANLVSDGKYATTRPLRVTSRAVTVRTSEVEPKLACNHAKDFLVDDTLLELRINP
jgi:hypothetical protein